MPTALLWLVLILLGAVNVFPAETTVYVNKFYEVREHDQPLKYVFNGDKRVARMSGSLSTNTCIQRLRLRPGWNLVSLAVTAPGALRQLTNPEPAVLDSRSIFQWSPQSQNWASVAPEETLPAGTVVWLHAASNITLSLTGTYINPPNRTVAVGPAFLPGAGLESLPLRGEKAAIQGAEALSTFDASTQDWRVELSALPQADPGFPDVLGPGGAVFVRAGASTQLEVPEAALRLRYYHPDHLGSSSVMTDANGALVEETASHPFGAPRHVHRPRDVEDSYQFTQKERDQESGLHYFGKRFYHSATGRWLSTDPLEEKGGSLNLYTYANQNPLKYYDPDGGEIKVTESIDRKTGIKTYRIDVKAVMVDVTSRRFSPKQVQDYADKVKATIEKNYSGQQGKTKWTTAVDLKVISDPSQRGKNDHLFRIVDRTTTGAGGTTDQTGGMLMDIAASTVLRKHPDQVDRNDPFYAQYRRLYNSPESTGAHEFGHAAGLEHADPKTPNLMQDGNTREHDNRDITLDQIKEIAADYKAGKLNKR